MPACQIRSAMAVVAGIVYVLAFEPHGHWFLAPVALAVLFWLWAGTSTRWSVKFGFLFGVGAFGVGVSWVYISLNRYGNMEASLAGLTVVLFVVILSMFLALAGWIQARLYRGRVRQLLLVMPVVWVTIEWIRSWMFGGFPWLYAGYTVIDTPLSALAPVFGIYGVSTAVAVAAGGLALAVSGKDFRLAGVGVVIGGLPVLVAFSFQDVEWTENKGDAIEFALIQRDIPLERKWAPGGAREILDEYLVASREAGDVDLIVWPEAAFPGYADQFPVETITHMEYSGADYLVGSLERHLDQRGEEALYNSALGISDGTLSFYRKERLVPFGEYIPFRSVIGSLLGSLDIPMSDLSSWRGEQPVMTLAGTGVGVSICYEDAFPSRIRDTLPDAGILVNISEDAWFGDSKAPHQRLQMARMRALESGRPMLRAGNNGLSSLIDRHGEVLLLAPQFQKATVTGSVRPATGVTPYVRFGDALIFVFLVVALVLSVITPKTTVSTRSATRS